ncbi:MAG: hypothetical protein GC204_02540 [Chloroflexi bacterium]|nr:hypothetical protein [Chloroflexota bacterium]
MSDEQLYKIARQRIQQRNRRWSLWALDLGVLIVTLAAMIMAGNDITVAIFLTWGAIFVVHTIITAFAESSESSIEREVARLRKAAAESNLYEKPKRLELSDDGELSESIDAPNEQVQRVSRNSN